MILKRPSWPDMKRVKNGFKRINAFILTFMIWIMRQRSF